MTKTLLLSVSLLFSGILSAQNENSHHCSKRDGFGAQFKSASLSVAEIAETEEYDVHFYALDLEMTNLNTSIDGTGEIHGTSRVAMDSVLFELYDGFTISDIRLNGVSTPYSRVGTAIRVPVNIAAGVNFAIAIDYDGFPATGASTPFGGSGMSNDSSPTWGNQVTWSLSEPFSAYEWWPCKQSLTDKADSSSVKLTVPDNCMAGSNGILEATVDLGNGTKRFEWMHRHAIDYYLISVAIAEYVEYNVFANPAGAPSPILIQNFIYNNPATLPNFQNDIDETVDFLELFSDLYGMYPFADEKYGHCMAPLSGGMEHQTMTTQGFFTPWLTAHELGHQWWGDYLTCGSWSDIWVNEGFASYSEHLMLENLYSTNDAYDDMFNRHDNIMSQNGGSVWVLDTLNENRIFSGRLTYDKGAAILHTFRYIMNDDADFFQALQDLQVDFADSTLIGLDVKEALETSSGLDLTDAFQEWYFGEGFPTYSARWNKVGSDLILEVSHTTSSSTPTFTNPIDVRFSKTFGPDTTIRLDINSNLEQFTFYNMGNINGLVGLDPDNYIINEIGSIVEDDNLTNSINDLTSKNDYIISPNPSKGNYTIETEMTGSQSFKIYDTRGRLIEEGSFSNSTKIDLTSRLNGNYIMQLTTESGDTRVKILVKN
ncbi:MAG: M1 family aminopeptidase [Crocinitomicaceae bacterium]|nr:M1 family aminopeptidase [Crocinitomicaceae bacterium]